MPNLFFKPYRDGNQRSDIGDLARPRLGTRGIAVIAEKFTGNHLV